MTYPWYYSSFSRATQDLPKYFIYPLCKATASYLYPGNKLLADRVAAGATSVFYAGLTNLFDGIETTGFDALCRKAVCAELGYRPEEFKQEHYLDSKNPGIRRFIDVKREMYAWRMTSAALPLVGLTLQYGLRGIPGMGKLSEAYEKVQGGIGEPEAEHSHRLGLDHHVVYAGNTVTWVKEYNVEKGFIYQLVKEAQTTENVGAKMTGNNVIGLTNRMRSDCDLPMLDGDDRNKLWPLMEYIAQRANASEKFNLDTIAYLLGTARVHEIFVKNADGTEKLDKTGHRIVDPKAYKRAFHAVEYVDRVGLDGIIEIKRAERLEREANGVKGERPKNFRDRVSRVSMNTRFPLYEAMLGKANLDMPAQPGPKSKLGSQIRFVERISPRDASEVPDYMAV